MSKEDGIYTVPCEVNGLKLRFIFDTGASTVCISLTEATFMLKNGYLNARDILGSSNSQIANGSIVENTIINLREIDIAGNKLYNIKAIVMNDLNAPLLLGQTAIQQLGRVELKGDELNIISGKSNISSEIYSTEPGWELAYRDTDLEILYEIDVSHTPQIYSFGKFIGNSFWLKITPFSNNGKKMLKKNYGGDWEKMSYIKVYVYVCTNCEYRFAQWKVYDKYGNVIHKKQNDMGLLGYSAIIDLGHF